jgi:hypothetical protein
VAPARGAAWLGVTVAGEQLHLEVRTREPAQVTAQLAETDRGADGPWRTGRVARTLRDASGAVIARDVVASNRKRLLTPHEQTRNCLTCNEPDCHARPSDLPRRT